MGFAQMQFREVSLAYHHSLSFADVQVGESSPRNPVQFLNALARPYSILVDGIPSSGSRCKRLQLELAHLSRTTKRMVLAQSNPPVVGL